VLPAQRTYECRGDVGDVNRRKARPCPRQWQPAVREPQQRGKARGERIPLAEDHRGAEDRPLQARWGRAQQLLRLALGAQVVTARLSAGIERTHLQQSRHTGLGHGRQQRSGELHVHAAQAPAPGSMQRTHQVDGHVAAEQTAAQKVDVIDVAGADLDTGQRQQLIGMLGMARDDAQLMSGAHQPSHKLRAHEARGAGYEDGQRPLETRDGLERGNACVEGHLDRRAGCGGRDFAHPRHVRSGAGIEVCRPMA